MVKLFIDGPTFKEMEEFSDADGWTFNPSLMKKLGITDYNRFLHQVLHRANGKPFSMEVLSDDFAEMEKQALYLHSFDKRLVYVKIPIMNTKGESSIPLIKRLSDKIKLNITAVMSYPECVQACRSLNPNTPAIVSIFAGRINDTGRGCEGLFTNALNAKHDNTEILWASTRQLYSVKEAERLGVNIITLSPELFKKRKLFGKDLKQYSIETIKQFHEDGKGIRFPI